MPVPVPVPVYLRKLVPVPVPVPVYFQKLVPVSVPVPVLVPVSPKSRSHLSKILRNIIGPGVWAWKCLSPIAM